MKLYHGDAGGGTIPLRLIVLLRTIVYGKKRRKRVEIINVSVNDGFIYETHSGYCNKFDGD